MVSEASDKSAVHDVEEVTTTMFTKANLVKHFAHCLLLLSLIILMEFLTLSKDTNTIPLNPWQQYGVPLTCLLVFLRILTLLALPQTLFNFLGLTCYNAFPDKVTLRSSPLLAPLICIRVVTRGDYPELVRKNMERNIGTCLEAGLDNFFMEVVTDKPVNLAVSPRCRELVIPDTYRTKSGALYKSRALQYCLEEKVNVLSDNDWIVHLDEETLLTEDSIRGILNFVIDSKHHIGQGLITYANEEIVNWFTTLADGFRVSDDMGKLRLQFKAFHKPLFSFKGSFVVVQYGTERTVSFDNGPDGSIAEDCFFAIKAYSQGYSFNFIDGAMWEKSPFTIKDFIQQRKRWLQGILLVVHSDLPWKNKFFLTMSCYAWITMPLTLSNFFVVPLLPLPSMLIIDCMMSFAGALNIYMFIFGVLKSFTIKRHGVWKCSLCVLGAVAVIPFNILVETVAVLWGYFGRKHKFYVVQKGTNGSAV